MVKICSVKVSDLRNSFQIYVFQNIFSFNLWSINVLILKSGHLNTFEYARKFKGAINCIGNKILAKKTLYPYSIDDLT